MPDETNPPETYVYLSKTELKPKVRSQLTDEMVVGRAWARIPRKWVAQANDQMPAEQAENPPPPNM